MHQRPSASSVAEVERTCSDPCDEVDDNGVVVKRWHPVVIVTDASVSSVCPVN